MAKLYLLLVMNRTYPFFPRDSYNLDLSDFRRVRIYSECFPFREFHKYFYINTFITPIEDKKHCAIISVDGRDFNFLEQPVYEFETSPGFKRIDINIKIQSLEGTSVLKGNKYDSFDNHIKDFKMSFYAHIGEGNNFILGRFSCEHFYPHYYKDTNLEKINIYNYYLKDFKLECSKVSFEKFKNMHDKICEFPDSTCVPKTNVVVSKKPAQKISLTLNLKLETKKYEGSAVNLENNSQKSEAKLILDTKPKEIKNPAKPQSFSKTPEVVVREKPKEVYINIKNVKDSDLSIYNDIKIAKEELKSFNDKLERVEILNNIKALQSNDTLDFDIATLKKDIENLKVQHKNKLEEYKRNKEISYQKEIESLTNEIEYLKNKITKLLPSIEIKSKDFEETINKDNGCIIQGNTLVGFKYGHKNAYVPKQVQFVKLDKEQNIEVLVFSRKCDISSLNFLEKCKKLKELVLPSSDKILDVGKLKHLKELRYLYIPKTYYGTIATHTLGPVLPNLEILQYEKNTNIDYYYSIGGYCPPVFKELKNLKIVVLPLRVSIIGNYDFDHDDAIEDIVFPIQYNNSIKIFSRTSLSRDKYKYGDGSISEATKKAYDTKVLSKIKESRSKFINEVFKMEKRNG